MLHYAKIVPHLRWNQHPGILEIIERTSSGISLDLFSQKKKKLREKLLLLDFKFYSLSKMFGEKMEDIKII